MNFHIVTLFPESVRPYLNSSILGRAQEAKKIKVFLYNPYDYADNKWGKVDNRPYGGGPGMVIEALPVLKAVEAAKKKAGKKTKILWFSPGGKQFDNLAAKKFSKIKDLILICGRYEGIDERVRKITKAESISVGPFVLSGGEVPAILVVDAVARHIPGVLGKISSLEESRVASSEVYTRPESFKYKGKKYSVPRVLLSGHHKDIEKWKEPRSGVKRTK